ncbi:MAG: DegT/DnrJ/EryC1/StrS family aminotransferase [Candidatus Hodarchaeales archaeon]|jgi:dTDP-4-amino-4,6-dideoxygalactose transaminase
MTSEKLAIFGGEPSFTKNVNIIKPNYSNYISEISTEIKEVLASNLVSGVNIKVKEFEEKLKEYLDVSYVITTSSCTSGMILALQAAEMRGKEFLVPSFSFSATAHMLYWNNIKMKFIDCDPKTLNVTSEILHENVSNETTGVLAVNMYGNPSDFDDLQKFEDETGIKIFYDSAHALGSIYCSEKVGKQGTAQSFSTSPTKVLSTIEGGIVTTDSSEIAQRVELGRNYGNEANYQCSLPGFNARMSEINAVVGLVLLEHLDKFVKNRNKYAKIYKNQLSRTPGITLQEIQSNSVSTYKDLSIFIDSATFGIDRTKLAKALLLDGVSTKFYFYPPISQLFAYKNCQKGDLKNTYQLANTVLSLPIYNVMDKEKIIEICTVIGSIHENAEKIQNLPER